MKNYSNQRSNKKQLLKDIRPLLRLLQKSLQILQLINQVHNKFELKLILIIQIYIIDIKVNDLLSSFGWVNALNHKNLQNMPIVVKENVNKEIDIQLLRLIDGIVQN